MRLERAPGLRQLPALLTRRRRDLVLFDSWRGTYSDNPRAISEALHERRPDLAQVWVAGRRRRFPRGPRPVRFGSRRVPRRARTGGLRRHEHRHARLLPQAPRHDVPPDLARHAAQADRLRHQRAELAGDRRFFERMRRDVAKWDFLVSPNPFSTEIFRRAFRFDGRDPRDGLSAQRPAQLARRGASGARRSASSLGIADATRAILYAPTWRDAAVVRRSALDVAGLGRRLGDGHALLLRTHRTAPADSQRRTSASWAIDVSAHPDIRELYLAADVLDHRLLVGDVRLRGHAASRCSSSPTTSTSTAT